MPPKLIALLTLSRVSNLPTVWGNCLAGWLLAGGRVEWEFIPLIVGASLIYSGGMVLNDAADAEFDREHRPERPIPSGVISRTAAWGLAIAFLALGSCGLVAAGAFVPWVVLLVVAVVVYDLWHKGWSPSAYVMGACRTLLYLAAASAAGGWFPLLAAVWGAGLGAYTVGITLAARGEAADERVPWLGLVLLGAPLVSAAVTLMMRDVTAPMAQVCLVAWLGWTGYCVVVLRGDGEGRVGRAVGFLIAGMLLIDALAVAPTFPWFGLGLMAALPGVLMWQRKIAAT